MLIATTNVDIEKCFNLSKDIEALESYIMSLIPNKYQHLSSIIGNQKYFINCRMFQSTTHSIEEKQELSEALMTHTRVAGILGTFITVSEVEGFVDRDLLKKYRKGK